MLTKVLQQSNKSCLIARVGQLELFTVVGEYLSGVAVDVADMPREIEATKDTKIATHIFRFLTSNVPSEWKFAGNGYSPGRHRGSTGPGGPVD